MQSHTKKYTLNAGIIIASILGFAYITTYIHEMGHALMIWICGGNVLDFTVKGPLSFDTVSGYVVSNMPYNVPIVSGGILATTIIAVILCLFARRTMLSYLMLCASVCTLYNAVYALSGFDDFTWLATQSWTGALLCIGFVVVNLYVAQQGLYDLFEDMWEYRTLSHINGLINAGLRLPKHQSEKVLHALTIIK